MIYLFPLLYDWGSPYKGNFTPIFFLPSRWPHSVRSFAVRSNLILLMFSNWFPKYHSPPHTIRWSSHEQPMGKFNVLVLDIETRLGTIIDLYQQLSGTVFPAFLEAFSETHHALHDACPEVDACWSEVLTCPTRFLVQLQHSVESSNSVNFVLKCTGRSSFGNLSIGKLGSP